jgi:hypothetical protein
MEDVSTKLRSHVLAMLYKDMSIHLCIRVPIWFVSKTYYKTDRKVDCTL